MAGSNRRLKLAAFVLPFLFLALAGLSRANELVVNTLSGEPAFPLCSLPDAIDAHNGIVNGCGPGSTDDTIFFAVTGTIAIDEPLVVMQGTLDIQGPLFGCTGGVLCGIRIDGEGTTQILITDPGTTVFLNSLTLLDGFVFSNTSGGGAIFANGSDLEIFDSLLVDNEAESSTGLNGGGAIYGNAGTMVIVNSTIADNVALNISTFFSLGGAIYNNI